MDDGRVKALLEKIFKREGKELEEPASWKYWKEGKSKYKPFSLQLHECAKNGTQIRETCHRCGQVLLLCKKHGGFCISSKCRAERTK
jgi:hypothetical protein